VAVSYTTRPDVTEPPIDLAESRPDARVSVAVIYRLYEALLVARQAHPLLGHLGSSWSGGYCACRALEG
jgi:hypothetical protein